MFQISISFSHTLGTRVRLSLMRSISKRQKLHDPQAVCSVTSFTARPLLRVGGKDKGTRFLSFVDAMLGFRHLLTDEDLSKAASLCTSMRGQLRSKFLVLSDDRPLPPPPAGRGKRPHPDHPEAEPNKPSKTSRQVSGKDRPQVSQASASDVGASFQVVLGNRSKGKKSLPDGVTPIPKRTTPKRAAKSRTRDDHMEDISEGVVEVVSGSESGSNDEDAASDKTVVDWVSLSSSVNIFLSTSLLMFLSTTPSLLITDLMNNVMSWVGLSIASRRLMISQ